MVVTKGDTTSEIVSQYKIGMVEDYQNVDGVADAIKSLIEMPENNMEKGFEKAREDLNWNRVAQPLFKYCRQPMFSSDRKKI